MTSHYWKEVATNLVADHPGEIAAAIIREQGDRSKSTWFAEHSDTAQVLYACVEQDSGAVWSALLPQLSSKDSAYMFSIGFPRGVVERVPPEQVLAWVGEKPDERAAMVAKLASKNLSNDETLSARVLGASTRRILFAHLVPNVLSIVIIYLTLTIPAVMLFEAFISFLGLGVQPPDISWGLLAVDSVEAINPVHSYWWLVVWIATAMGVTLLALNVLGDGVRDALDPKLRGVD